MGGGGKEGGQMYWVAGQLRDCRVVCCEVIGSMVTELGASYQQCFDWALEWHNSSLSINLSALSMQYEPAA